MESVFSLQSNNDFSIENNIFLFAIVAGSNQQHRYAHTPNAWFETTVKLHVCLAVRSVCIR